MPTPSEHKTVQARILAYAEAIGWTIVSREEAEQRRGFDPDVPPADRAKNRTLFFDDLLDAKVREFNSCYAEAEGALLGKFRHLHTDIYGNREFIEHLRNRGKFFDHEEKRERDLILIDYDNPARNVYEVTEEWAFHNGRYGTREDVVFFINGIPVLVIECKNAGKEEAIALGVDQIRRYHRETPELFVPEQIFTATDAIGFSYGVSWNTVRRNIFNEGELDENVVIRKFRTTTRHGAMPDKTQSREVHFYNLDVIISVGYRVKSRQGTRFRIWATQRLKEYIVKGFALNDERFKSGNSMNYFTELQERIREIRLSERFFYQKIKDIYTTSIDYDPKDEKTLEFLKIVQNKLLWAISRQTTAELIYRRVDADRAKNRSLFFNDLLDAKVREFNPCYTEAVGATTIAALNALNTTKTVINDK